MSAQTLNLSPGGPSPSLEDGAARVDPAPPGSPRPLIVRPLAPGPDGAAWAAPRREALRAALLSHGAVLLRGFRVPSLEAFERIAEGVGGGLLDYRERSSPRHRVAGQVYTSTDYPADQAIPYHNENSYAGTWPALIFFYCSTAPARGGETILTDCRGVLARLAEATRARFRAKGVLYVRNYRPGIGLPWQDVFQTSDRAEAEAHCRRAGYQVEWRGDVLRTKRAARAIVAHPVTGAPIWFNHAAFFHKTSLPANVLRALGSFLAEEELPNHTYYGDGSPIEAEALREIRAAYDAEALASRWEEQDVLILDNMRIAHGRAPFSGPRRVLVAMAEPLNASAMRDG